MVFRRRAFSVACCSQGVFFMKKNLPELMNIPIFIISFNRLEYLQKQIAFLERYNLRNIHIIDNQSTYPPLLNYYKTLPYHIYYMKKNYGHEVLFKVSEFADIVDNSYFVLTDPDVVAVDECPEDFLSLFFDLLCHYPKINKAGFSLKLDDIPDSYALKQSVLSWENKFYCNVTLFQGINVYEAPIDTTFALYRPRKAWKRSSSFFAAIRTGYPYAARHLPWYKNLDQPSEEDVFYNNLDAGLGNWNGKLNAR